MPILEVETVRDIIRDGLHGRRAIYTNVERITESNVIDVLSKAMTVHQMNAREIQYLYEYYRGKQDIRFKYKIVREEINNKVTVNRANEIVTFKTAYFLSDPVQYVSHGKSKKVSNAVSLLNQYMASEDKVGKDKQIVDWMHICGVGVRMVLPDNDSQAEQFGSPVNIYSLDPREAFVIYSSRLGHKPMAGVLIQKNANDEQVICVYTNSRYFEIKQNKIVVVKSRTVPYVPIIEYLNNGARLGAFEIVISMLNAINNVESNRVDAIQDFVNAFDVFQNCEIDEETYKTLSEGGKAIQIKSQQGVEAKVYRIVSNMDQGGSQSVINDMYDAVLTICGMPNRNGNGSTSDTGSAVIFRDGWGNAESRAKDTEDMYNSSEWQFLRIALYILNSGNTGFNLKLEDIKIEHTRNNLANMQSRMQVLCEGLNNEKIHPKLPWIMAGIPNAEENYNISMEYYEEQQAKMMENLDETVQTSGQSNSNIA